MNYLRPIFYITLACLFLIASCSKQNPQLHNSKSIRISSECDPQTLDPRRRPDLGTVTVIHALYEGLTRQENHSSPPALALAEKIDISEDQKTITFTLRESKWSDGSPVTAYDFEQTWKSILDPQFPSPNAYQLYVISGAQDAKEGKAPLENVGVHAIDNKTLVVHLHSPTPYFLQLTSTYFFYPVHSSMRSQIEPSQNDLVITNGPFQFKYWKHNDELGLVANPFYWNSDHVHLESIRFVIVDNPTALQLYHQGELDWIGSPLSTLTTESLSDLKRKNELTTAPSAGTYFVRVQVEEFPFSNQKIRQSLALALNRKDLVDHVLLGNQIPTVRIVPPMLLENVTQFHDNDKERAKTLFKEGLEETQLTASTFPPVTLAYAASERSQKIAQVLQQQWKEALGIHVQLQSLEGKVYYDLLKNHTYQLALGGWFADIPDPISFLELFKSKDNGFNSTQWEHSLFSSLLDQSTTGSPMERIHRLQQAENILVDQMPAVPLFYNTYNYVKRPEISNVYFSELGYLDFKNCDITRN